MKSTFDKTVYSLCKEIDELEVVGNEFGDIV